eukprot:7841392-Lingulodinium_polyedra.AAC.1
MRVEARAASLQPLHVDVHGQDREGLLVRAAEGAGHPRHAAPLAALEQVERQVRQPVPHPCARAERVPAPWLRPRPHRAHRVRDRERRARWGEADGGRAALEHQPDEPLRDSGVQQVHPARGPQLCLACVDLDEVVAEGERPLRRRLLGEVGRLLEAAG